MQSKSEWEERREEEDFKVIESEKEKERKRE